MTSNILGAIKDKFDLASAWNYSYSYSGSHMGATISLINLIRQLFHVCTIANIAGFSCMQSAVVLFETVAITLFGQSRAIPLSLPTYTTACRYDNTGANLPPSPGRAAAPLQGC